MNAFILVYLAMFFIGCAGGYLVGRNQSKLLDKIRTLQEQAREPKPEPVQPTIVGGAYQPPKPVSTAVDSKQGAGIVESKTPQQLEWENRNEMAKLEQGA